jgi:tetratricopeptide (TPR) repeat protein
MKKNKINLYMAVFLFIPIFFLQKNIDDTRKKEGLNNEMVIIMPGQVAGSLILSGFKGIASDMLWLNIDKYWHQGHHYKMLPLFQTAAWLQPEYVTTWSVGSWHMAYNIAAGCNNAEKKKFWYKNAVEFLQQGIAYNPKKYDLYFELGWIYLKKGRDFPNAVKYLEKAIQFPHPGFVNDVLAHAYEKNGQKKQALIQWEHIKENYPELKIVAEKAIKKLKNGEIFHNN